MIEQLTLAAREIVTVLLFLAPLAALAIGYVHPVSDQHRPKSQQGQTN